MNTDWFDWGLYSYLKSQKEGENPSVACGESREMDEKHAPTGLTNPLPIC